MEREEITLFFSFPDLIIIQFQMENQNYTNHVRYYPAHHFVFYPLLTCLLGVSTYFMFNTGEREAGRSPIWLCITLVILLVGWLSFMLRQHYALGNQNRIVRIEMRFRYYVLTHKRLEALEDRLSFGQIAALRFASDDELPALVQRTVTENLRPDEIKKAIVNWLPDDMRR